MARNKLTISFDGFEEIMEKLDRATADTKKSRKEHYKNHMML